MAFFLYASFPNSRIKPRAATSTANTYQVNLDIIGSPLTLVAGEDLNRTYALLQNFSQLNSLYYLYAKTGVIDPSVVATNGLTGALFYNSGTNTLYQKQDDGTTTNWVVVLPQDVGELILPGATASLECPQDIYALANSFVPLIPALKVGVDVGFG